MLKHFFLSGAAALLFPIFISDSTLHYSNSIFSILAFLCIFLMLRHAARQDFSIRLKKYTYVLGFLFSLMTAWGYALGNIGSINYFNPVLLASIAVFAYVYAKALALLWQLMDHQDSADSLRSRTSCPPQLCRLIDTIYQNPLLLFILLLLCWAPCYISTFPGNFVYDASYEYYQLKDGFTRSYPLLHSVIITRLFALSECLTGSVNPGIAIYTIVQLLAAATLFTLILRRFYLDSIHPALLGLLTLYYALFPVIHFLVACTTRDVMFSILITWLVYLLYLLQRRRILAAHTGLGERGKH